MIRLRQTKMFLVGTPGAASAPGLGLGFDDATVVALVTPHNLHLVLMPPRKRPISKRRIVSPPNESTSEAHDDQSEHVSFRAGSQDELWDEEEPILESAEPPAKKAKV